MVRLSVNVNKVATVRNSRGGGVPSVLEAVKVCIAAGSPGITVHPRADARHITAADVREISTHLRSLDGRVEYNIEGDPRPDLLDLVHEVTPDQCTLVPVRPGEITSQAGWSVATPRGKLEGVVSALKADGIRVSLFVDPEDAPVRWAADLGADRVELYTEPFARAFERGAGEAQRSFETYARVARLAHSLGLGVNAGHDLDLDNLVLFRGLPHLDEVSIGHALISHALFVGLDQSVREYLDAWLLEYVSSQLDSHSQLVAANSQPSTPKRPRRWSCELVRARRELDAAVRCRSWSARRVGSCRRPFAALSVEAAGRAVTFRAEDGRTLTGYIVEAGAQPSPAVVLVPMLGRPKDDWQAVAQRLADANITAVAIDLPGEHLPADANEAAGWSRDVAAAVAYLASRPDVRRGAIGVAGASLGANLAALAAAGDPQVRSVVLVSPSLDYRGVRIEGAMRQLGNRPALLIASLRDTYAARSVRELADGGPGLREMRWSEAPAHGTALLSRDPDLVRALVEFFQRTLG